MELYLQKCFSRLSLISFLRQMLVRDLDRGPALLKIVSSLIPREQGSDFPHQVVNSVLHMMM